MSNTYRGSTTPRAGSVITIGADEISNAPYGDIAAETMQGAINELDDEKVAKAGDTMTGDLTVPNIVTAGNVDGRDVSVDGAKLDGIEALADVTDVTNVTAAGALMDSEVDIDIKTLVLPANTTISTFGATVIDDADANAARTTLGLGTLAQENTAPIAQGGTGQTTAQAGIDALTAVSVATDEYVLTKDTTSGSAEWKIATSGTTATTTSEGVVELATDAEVATGTDTVRVAPVSALGSHQGVCKAWVNFNGTGTVAIADSYNVSSITDNGTGSFTINFTNAMSNANYSAAVGGSGYFKFSYTYTTTDLLYVTRDLSNAVTDYTVNVIQVFGD